MFIVVLAIALGWNGGVGPPVKLSREGKALVVVLGEGGISEGWTKGGGEVTKSEVAGREDEGLEGEEVGVTAREYLSGGTKTKEREVLG